MERAVLKLPKELTIFTVEIFWKTLLETLEDMKEMHEKNFVLYFGDLEKIDGAGMQLLLSLEKTLLKEKLQLEYKEVNDSIKKVLKLVGVGYLLAVAGEKDE